MVSPLRRSGNHDVQRKISEDRRGLRTWLAENHDVARIGRWLVRVDKPPGGTQPQWIDDVLKRTEAFWSWFESYRGTAVSGRGDARTGYRETLRAGTFEGTNTPVHIVGLDSAWLCGPLWSMSASSGVSCDWNT
jgi:hypothetical protein